MLPLYSPPNWQYPYPYGVQLQISEPILARVKQKWIYRHYVTYKITERAMVRTGRTSEEHFLTHLTEGCHGSALMNPTSIHEDVGSIPDLSQLVG